MGLKVTVLKVTAVEKLLFKPAEAAELLGLGRSKVYALVASGGLPSIRIGRNVRIPAEALRQWVRDQSEAVDTGRREPPLR